MLARRQHPGNRVQPPPRAALAPRRAKRLLASWWFRIQCGRRSAFTSYCCVAILVVIALTLALPLLRYRSLDEDSLGCLKALQGAESLVICDEKSALCESLAQMPLFYIVTTDALKHSGHLEQRVAWKRRWHSVSKRDCVCRRWCEPVICCSCCALPSRPTPDSL